MQCGGVAHLQRRTAGCPARYVFTTELYIVTVNTGGMESVDLCSVRRSPPDVDRAAHTVCDAQILQFAQDLHLDGIAVRETGCLGKCGNGPNVAVSPPGVVMNHMATPARFADAMRAVCGAEVTLAVLRATELRLAGNAQVLALTEQWRPPHSENRCAGEVWLATADDCQIEHGCIHRSGPGREDAQVASG